MRKELKFITTHKYLKRIIFVLIGIFILKEMYSVYIDAYNFRQLEEAKPVLESIPKNSKKFYSLHEFNALYKMNIVPIKNCYYISNNNGKYPYIFGFKLESLTYRLFFLGNNNSSDYIYQSTFKPEFVAKKLLNFGKNYTYPGYDLTLDTVCLDSLSPVCSYGYMIFDWTISNTCRDN